LANISNTLIAGNTTLISNTGPSYSADDCNGTITSGDYNLVQNTSGCTLSGTHNVIGLDPLLGPLQNNGGPTQTMALQLGSPAIDTGNSATCAATDQRGLPRNAGSCDIGAYELQASTCVVPPSGLVSWWTGDGNALDFQAANNGALAGGA